MDDRMQDDDFVLVPKPLPNTLQSEPENISLEGPLMDANAMLRSELKTLNRIRDSVEKLLASAAASLSCGICHEVLRNPSTLRGCGHTYCSACSESLFAHTLESHPFRCPACRDMITVAPVPAFVLNGLLSDIDAFAGEIREMVTTNEVPSMGWFLHDNGPRCAGDRPDWELYF
ncbi:hypothetical protein EDD15DRAFT_2192529 [Pisolithus albus]|nr:hypothetical protein EDD15DRAFT_2192526 [Pisolithus albus]KAI6001759.1 hypothetical protein EDD15DRAFT_2192529 [Pisolithus albus]